MEKFNLSHLEEHRDVAAIHNDESLLLYSIVRCSRIERILEIGGGEISFSAINFLRAQEIFTNAIVYTVDMNPVKKLSDNHKVIKKDCNDLLPSDLDNKPIDLIFFDCHLIIAQLNLYNLLKEHNLITEDTIIVLHDTNLFYEPYVWEKDYIGDYNIPFDKVGGGFAHQWVERQMCNYFKLQGYDIFSIRTKPEDHNENFPIRQGLSICQKFKPMTPFYLVYDK